MFPLFWSHTWKYKIQVHKSLSKVKEKWSTIQFDVFLSFYYVLPFNATDSNWHKQVVYAIIYTHQTSSKCASVCMRNCMNQMRRLICARRNLVFQIVGRSHWWSLYLRWLVGLKLIQFEQQKTQLPVIIVAKNLKPILCRTIKGT